MKIFLTGGSGFIGQNFIKLAISKGHFVYATSRKKQNFENKNLKWLVGDFHKEWKELKKSQVLVHLAASGVIRKKNNKKLIYDVNINKSEKLLDNAIKFGCKKWLVASTSSEYGKSLEKHKMVKISTIRKPDDLYSKSKSLFTDLSIKKAKLKNCKLRIMRIFPVYGEGEDKKRLYTSLKHAANKGLNFKVNNPNEIRDFTNVSYVSKVLLEATDFNYKKFKNYQIWHVSENKVMNVKQFTQKIWKKFNAKKKLIFDKKNKKTKTHVSHSSSRWT